MTTSLNTYQAAVLLGIAPRDVGALVRTGNLKVLAIAPNCREKASGKGIMTFDIVELARYAKRKFTVDDITAAQTLGEELRASHNDEQRAKSAAKAQAKVEVPPAIPPDADPEVTRLDEATILWTPGRVTLEQRVANVFPEASQDDLRLYVEFVKGAQAHELIRKRSNATPVLAILEHLARLAG